MSFASYLDATLTKASAKRQFASDSCVLHKLRACAPSESVNSAIEYFTQSRARALATYRTACAYMRANETALHRENLRRKHAYC